MKKLLVKQRHQRNHVKKVAKKKALRKKYEKLKNIFPITRRSITKVKKIDGKYIVKRRPQYPQMQPASKKFKAKKAVEK